MNTYTINITLYDLFFFGIIFTGAAFALLLGFVKGVNRTANRFLALALATMILWMMHIVAGDIRLETYLSGWNRLSMHFLLALGPLIYFYVRKITNPERKFSWKDLLHFCPVLLEEVVWVFSVGTLLKPLAFISVCIYLYRSRNLIEHFYQRLKFNEGDRYRYKLKWLHKLLTDFGLIWLLWIPFAAADFYFHLDIRVEYTLYVLLGVMLVRMGAVAHLRFGAEAAAEVHPASKSSPGAELKQKASWLKQAVESRLLYEDPDLSLSTLAGQLDINPHELSRIINAALKKSFADFINEYRIREVTRKMQDPSYDTYTLLGIAYDSGFNSKTNFNRAFRQLTGKSPTEYKKQLKKVRPFYNTEPELRTRPLILHRGPAFVWAPEKLNRNNMFLNYSKIAWRNLTRNKASSFVNIGGLAVGMAVAILIGLWIWDEESFDQYHQNYHTIAKVMQNKTFSGTVNTDETIPLPLEDALRKKYGIDFKHIVLASWTEKHVLNFGDQKINFTGNFMSPVAPEIFTLRMLAGNRNGLTDKSSLLLSAATAKALFGNMDPLNKVISLDNNAVFKVAGIYEDLPQNSTLHDLGFIGAFDYYIHSPGNERSPTDWGDNSLYMYVQLADHADMAAVSAKIRDIKLNSIPVEDRKFKPAIFLQPMNKWHLYSEFKDGVNTGGAIQYVWLFGIIGIFILLLACINFMNLSTARSEKRAKEVGIRKAVGSLKHQLVKQFYWESFLTALIAFVVSLALVWIALPWFNTLSGKQIELPFSAPLFWAAGIGFTFFTAIIAGSYPALYLSSFNPVKVLKGTFKAGASAALPRKILVTSQFAVSIILMIATIIVFRQIQFGRNRPTGYNRAGLIDIQVTNDDLHKQFAAVKADLLSSGAVSAIAEASSSTTGINNNRGDISWSGKDPSQADFFGSIRVTAEYGRTVGWQFTAGHDFTPGNVVDSVSVILNESAANHMGFKQPVGQIIRLGKRDLTVIGVVKNMVMESPYEPVKQAIFYLGRGPFDDVLIRISPHSGMPAALNKIAAVSKTYSPSVPFSYRFADDEYARKFATEERVATLASTLAALAIFISCIGLFGMASFMAEQRVKEIGVRKVLGASVFNLWHLMSKEFIILIGIAFLIAAPIAYVLMHNWLQHYTYRTGIPWWIFASTATCSMLITLLTVSYQSIKAALSNPVKSLKSE